MDWNTLTTKKKKCMKEKLRKNLEALNKTKLRAIEIIFYFKVHWKEGIYACMYVCIYAFTIYIYITKMN